MEEDGATKFDFLNGCSEATNTIIARYRMVINLIENEQIEHDELQIDTCTDPDTLHQGETIEDPIYEINIIENPNKTRK